MTSLPILHASRRLLPSLASAPLSSPHHTTIGNWLPLLLRPSSSPRSFSATPITCSSAAESGDHAHSQYDPPTGWLFGVKPGEKYKKEGWEDAWIYGYWGTLLLATIAYIYKPDTSIQTWALEEARRRLEAEGILPDPDLQPNSQTDGV